jgi:serine/threonine protein phosphatase PrpC
LLAKSICIDEPKREEGLKPMSNEHSPWTMKLAGVSDRGLAQRQNEDRCFIGGMEEKLSFAQSNCGIDGDNRWTSVETSTQQSTVVMAVADGFGGLPSGVKAAEIAIRTAMEYMSSSASFLNVAETIKGHFAKALVRRAFDLCDQEINEQQRRIPQDRGMRTTLSIVVVTGNEMTIAHTGDCRVYLVRNGHIQLLTRDHLRLHNAALQSTLHPQTTEAELLNNCVWNCLGGRDAINPDLLQVPLYAGDCVLVSSNGLFCHVSQDEILDVAIRLKSPEQICEMLLHLAMDRGGHENTTILSCCIRNPVESESTERKTERSAIVESADYMFRSSLGFGICF